MFFISTYTFVYGLLSFDLGYSIVGPMHFVGPRMVGMPLHVCATCRSLAGASLLESACAHISLKGISSGRS
jgi:hypothetical protein